MSQQKQPNLRRSNLLRLVVRVALMLTCCGVGIWLGWWQLWLFLLAAVLLAAAFVVRTHYEDRPSARPE